MKVVEGNFGKTEEKDKPPLKECVLEALDEIGLSDATEGVVFMAINTDERLTFVTNEPNAGDLLMMLEMCKGALIQSQMMGE